MSVKMRREVEMKIVSAFVDSALSNGYRLSVSLEKGYDTDEMLLGSTDKEKILKEAFAGDDCHVFVHESTGELIEDELINCIGWIYFVYGNDGWDVMSDWTENLEFLLKESLEISDHYS